jgi:hypothetical protein
VALHAQFCIGVSINVGLSILRNYLQTEQAEMRDEAAPKVQPALLAEEAWSASLSVASIFGLLSGLAWLPDSVVLL